MKEIWKDIVGYEGLYRVSNLGRVYSCFLKRTLSEEQNHGYKRVVLCKDKDNHKHKRVHILVAETFLDKNNFKYVDEKDRLYWSEHLNGLVINHKDENKCNNNVNNLEWCTPKYNIYYGECRNKIGGALGKKVYQYDTTHKLINVYNSASAAARENNVKVSLISQCCSGKVHLGKGYIWSYEEVI